MKSVTVDAKKERRAGVKEKEELGGGNKEEENSEIEEGTRP